MNIFPSLHHICLGKVMVYMTLQNYKALYRVQAQDMAGHVGTETYSNTVNFKRNHNKRTCQYSISLVNISTWSPLNSLLQKKSEVNHYGQSRNASFTKYIGVILTLLCNGNKEMVVISLGKNIPYLLCGLASSLFP